MQAGARLDTTYLVETPEGIDLQAQLAGPVVRVLAYSIDLCIRSAVLFGLMLVLMFMGKAGEGFFLISAFLAEWFYPVYFEVRHQGQTPGKKILAIQVVNDDLTPISWGTSFIRNLLRAADFAPVSYVAGLVAMSCSPRFQRLGDMAAGTVVVHRIEELSTTRLPECHPVTPPAGLDIDDQVAMVNFLQRHDQLTQDRQEELAGILEPLTGRRGVKAVEYLRGVGAWLLGNR